MNISYPLEVVLTPNKAALAEGGSDPLQVLVRLRPQKNSRQVRTPLSLAIVIDRSGSMAGGRLRAAIDCTKDLINRLHADDEVSIVIYDDEVEVLMPLSSAESARSLMHLALDSVRLGGSTNLHGGWLKAAEQLAPRTGANRICRVMLLSDGQANYGVTNIEVICTQVKQLARTGITTSTVGIGLNFNERLMTEMAVAGQGTAMYGVDAVDLAEPFEAELGLLAHTIWRKVSLKMSSPAQRWMMHNDYQSIGENEWRLTSIASGAEAWLGFSVSMKEAIEAQQRDPYGLLMHVIVSAVDAEGVRHTFEGKLNHLPLVPNHAWLEMPTDELVLRRFCEIEAADLQREVREAVRRRDWHLVERILEDLQERARDNPWLLATVRLLKDLLAQRDHQRMEKELMYSASAMKMRLTETDEPSYQSMSEEIMKPAYLRRKVNQGRRSEE